MQVSLLGPVEISHNGVPRAVPGLRRQALLAVLALHCGEVVDAGRLTDLAWGTEARPAVNTLQTHVSHLRRTVQVPIVARAAGYFVDLGEDGTDVRIAERLIRTAQPDADPGGAVAQLRQALALWRGQPLAGLDNLSWFAEQARRLDGLRLQAQRSLIDAQLALGQHADLVDQLERLVLEHPYDESLHTQLMLALYRCGRQADALAGYDRLRRALADALGLEPGELVRDQHARILRQDPSLRSPATVLAPGRPRAVPAQLPSVPAFSGRRDLLARLDAVLPDRGGDRAAAAPMAVVVVSGAAGIGKTTLAVHWAHTVADRFPDGQLYVNLRGYDPGGPALDPGTVVSRFLQALDVPPDQCPPDLDAQIGLYRSLVSGRRMLVVLDNARDVGQVRPLLPGASGCLAIVTSRDRLTPLVANEGARPLMVELMSAAEAGELLASRLGADRVMAEPGAVQEIITYCARLPLALAIAAARARTHSSHSLSSLAAELRAAEGRLGALSAGDPGSDLRTVFSWSEHTLSADARRLFRLLGLHPGDDLGDVAAASLAGLTVDQARQLVVELTSAHLLTEHTPGRYTVHDLLRAYAREQVESRDSEQDRRAALGRLFDHYLHSAHAATHLLSPTRSRIGLRPPRPGVILQELADHDAAMAWLATEEPVLVSIIDRAAASGFEAHVWQLAWALSTFLYRRARWSDQVTLQQTALRAAGRLGDGTGQAHILRNLGLAQIELGHFEAAAASYEQARHFYAGLGDRTGEAHAYVGLMSVADRQHDVGAALQLGERALELYRDNGDLVGQANTLGGIGWQYTRLGNHRMALAYCRRALPILQEVGYREAEAGTWDSVGSAYRGLGDYPPAIDSYQRALELYRALGHRYGEAEMLTNLGDTHDSAGQPDSARRAWRQALDLLTELDHPDAAGVRAKLDRLGLERP